MKKWFNRTRKPAAEWENYDEGSYDEGSYDWDKADQELEEYYMEEGELEEETALEETYYAEEAVLEEEIASEEAYYYEEETALEGETTSEEAYYYEEEAALEEETASEEIYYADEAALEDEAYYEDGAASEEAYYAEGTEEDFTESGEYDEAYYAETEYEDAAEDSLEYNDAEENSFRGGTLSARKPTGRQPVRKKGFMGKVMRGFSRMDIMDRVILGTGLTVLILALITGGVYISSRIRMNQVSAFASVGSQLDDIDLIGEEGLLAVTDAQIARWAAADLVNVDQQQGEEDQDKGYDEEEYRREVQVTMEFVSIQKDLKIKFVNEKTGKLVANVPFAVTVTDPDGKKIIWSDDDMDGIIYKKDITPGNYKVAMEALADERYASYSLSTLARTVAVKKDIAYEKVEVANEIKSESEVDASKEDTKKNETVVESTLSDTVPWVESSVTAAAYSEVAKSSIPDPMTLALGKSFIRASKTGTVSGSDLTKGTVTIAPATVSVVQGGTITSQADVSGFTKNQKLTYSISPASNKYAKAVIDSTGKITVTGVAAGSTEFTVTVNYTSNGRTDTAAKATLKVTVTPPKTLTLDKTAATAFVGEALVINATVSNAVSPVITAVSQDESIASVSVSNTAITVNGKKAGVVNVTVSFTENNVVTAQATCVVTVKGHPKNDNVSLLKDANGKQLYVQENGIYREATYADYYVESNKFYLQSEVRYTGWQTLDGKVYYFTAQGEKVVGEQIIQGAKYNFASDGSLVTGTGTLGIDVSKWNGNIDWNAVKNSGISYVIIRCGYRGSSAGSLIEDPKFVSNIKGATAAGLKVGVYFFTQAIDEREAVEEASMVLELVKNYTISYPIFLDVESSGGRADSINMATRTAVCKAFCQTIQNAHYTAGIYANKSWLEGKIDASALGSYKIWLAQYAAAPTYTGRYDMWQYRSTGSVSGINGNVDMNLSYLGY